MDFRRRQLFGWGLLAAVALAGAAWLAQLDFARKISTDVLDLVPSHNVAPELMLVRQLAGDAEARTVLVALTIEGRAAPAAAAEQFAAALRTSPAFDQVVAMGDGATREALGKELFAQRFALLFPRWVRERMVGHAAAGSMGDPADWLANDAATALGKFLETPGAVAFQDLVPSDPLLLLPATVEKLQGGLALVQQPAGGEAAALVWARLAASPMTEAGQAPAFAALEAAADASRRDHPGLVMAFAGVNRFAATSRARIESEVKWLNTGSLVAVLAVALTFIRRPWRGLHLVPVVLLSMLGAWVGTTLVFERVPVLVFVFGSLLTGVAIDYGFYLFMQAPAAPGEDYWAKVRRLAKPLLASCLTTVAGFALLLFSDLPFIRQLGVFVGSGLISALVTAVIYFSTVRNPFLEAREFRGPGWAEPTRRKLRWLLLAAWLVALPGLARLQWKDDIRELEIPSPELKREDARIRALFGEQSGGTVYVTYGENLAAARDALEKLNRWLANAGQGRTRTVGLAPVIPTADEAKEAADFIRDHPDFSDKLRAALERAGFAAEEFAPFFADYARNAARPDVANPAAAVQALQTKLSGPLGLLIHPGEPLSWYVTLAKDAPAEVPSAETQTVSTGQLQTLNDVFARYRRSAMGLSAIGLAIVGIGVLLTYGLRDGVRIFAIPCGACLGLFGLLGWLGVPLNLFHLLGAFLGVCLTHNYSIFSATSAYRREAPPVSVRMSALTTAASFGVLAMSGIPVVRALGVTVALMVVVALVVIELEHLAALGRKP